MRKLITYTTIATALMFSGSCSFLSAPSTPPVPLATINFDFNPPESNGEKSEIKIALIKPKYVKEFENANIDPFKTFVGNMEKDFEEILSARGYTLIGPYESVDQLVYSDKVTTDLILNIEVTSEINGNYYKKRDVPQIGQGYSKTFYEYNGSATITGKVNISLSEPFTATKLWIKSVSFNPTTIYFDSKSYETSYIPLTDKGVWNPLVGGLESIYKSALQTCWNHLEPMELKAKKADAIEIKKNSGFMKK